MTRARFLSLGLMAVAAFGQERQQGRPRIRRPEHTIEARIDPRAQTLTGDPRTPLLRSSEGRDGHEPGAKET